MLGFLVRHTHRGIGKIIKTNENHMVVHFYESDERALFERTAFSNRELKRLTLSKKSICSSDGRECIVEDRVEKDEGCNLYQVTFQDDGLRTEVSEVDLIPTGFFAYQEPIEKLQNQDQGSYALFRPRERLLGAINQQLKNGNGLRALLSSRIDLRPHQAYVAGIVLLDESRRYLLADEVGLGKTIEAGIVIHDLLISKPDARVLVLCPGALTQQWLCEMYSKFSGQVFRMLEMTNAETANWENVTKLIASFSDGGLKYSKMLLEQEWDLVVVDEVHHLLSSQPLYDFVHALSKQVPSILLLSAIPAKRREDEFLRLLALLEPERYSTGVDTEAFKNLFESQRSIGRKLRLIRRRLDGIAGGDFSKEETLEQIEKLAELESVAQDITVCEIVKKLPSLDSEAFTTAVYDLLRHVAENFRINRRILRNRRQRLIEDDQIASIERVVETVGYESDQLEHEVNGSISDLLNDVVLNKAEPQLVEVFASVLWQSAVHPNSILDLLQLLEGVDPGQINASGREFLRLGYLGGNASWENYVELLCKAIKPYVSDELIQSASKSASKWRRDSNGNSRLANLITVLKTTAKQKEKVLIFVGYPRVAELITDALRSQFGDASTTEFLSELEREEKEANVRRFRSDPNTWILVSDESGGEGRNFQFVDLLVHYDTPWNVSRVEQRIGRLDRLGRESPQVKSVVICDSTSVEGGLVQCYRDGLGVYNHSISGLEFALREVESDVINRAIESSYDGLLDLIEDIKETVELERDRDESEAVLDEASFDRKTAERFLRVRSSEESEIELEEAFLDFFQMVATSGKLIAEPEFPEGIWSFDGDRIHQIRNAFTNQLANRKFIGSFRRSIAQKRVDLEYFGLGNALFEAIYHSLHVENLGRTYAIEVNKPDIKGSWLGFEFIFYPSPKLEYLGNNPGLINQARQYFNFRPIHIFCKNNGVIELHPDKLLSLRKSLTHEGKSKVWKNFTGGKANQLAELFQKSSWEDSIANSCNSAKNHALNECKEYVSPVIEEALEVLSMQIKNVSNLELDSVYLQPLLALQKSIQDWDLELDSLGFFALNAGIHNRFQNE
ncbi:SNF2-related protein [bacterium]|nr:SNF2-related protein [bacterium]